ncbi:hypothetical protein BTO06_06665 [Tenacibaculum sp. SZ-18]|uniref:lipoprotein N-acyltransferase Lnb domain-containing protein n=1 Tax=Tenacibaculum sp. SZ-18 TaxID=754423 RepID=UPI000C2CE3D6|nr:DUF4105 domain-containing protein [Tenacibaculum sp. SZ-18]AUC14841.1 hypothetical protein BTO06_06665 [Tenacibaculum sp. SZ-18]
MFKKHFLLLLFITQFSYSQKVQLSVYSEISIITSGPGDNLYEKFGHTAIRVKDPLLNLDLLYNYGIFDFSDPNFYTNFVRGFMKYKLARYPFHYALKSAKEDKRWVKQQVLNLNQQEKTEFFYFLENNAKPENANYFYDPFFDNCATRPRDLVKSILKNKLLLNEDFARNPKTIRILMNKKIHPNSWGSFGINIALGNKLDKIATPEEYLYLPEYLYLAYKNSKIKSAKGEEKLITKETTLIEFENKEVLSDSFSPFLVFSILFILVAIITYLDYKKQRQSKFLDFLLLFSSGLVGILIVFLWFFTNHSTAPNNFNFLWGFAPNLIVSFLFLKRKKPNWIHRYFSFITILLLFIPIIHFTKIQQFTYPIIPLTGLLFIRYIFLYTLTQNKKLNGY